MRESRPTVHPAASRGFSAGGGGAIYLTAPRLFLGENASIDAKGNNGSAAGGAGAGGRIAVYRLRDCDGSLGEATVLGTVMCVTGGTNSEPGTYPAEPGTKVYGFLAPVGLTIFLR